MTGAGPRETPGLRHPDAANVDFIDRDDDRFNVWVHDLATWNKQANVAAADKRVRVSISTENVAGFTKYNDDKTAVDLVRVPAGTGKGDGWFWSDSQMLVSNAADDQMLDNKGVVSGFAAEYVQKDDTAPGGRPCPRPGTRGRSATGRTAWRCAEPSRPSTSRQEAGRP